MKRVKILFFILMFLVTSLSIAQYGIETSINDYQTKSDGDWSNYSLVWERWNGTEWVAANSYPDWQNANTITIKHDVTLDVDITIDQTIIQTGKRLQVNSGKTLTVRNAIDSYDLWNRGTIENMGTIVLNSGAVIFNDEWSYYYHARDGGVIPSMSWETLDWGSCCHITGIQTNAPTVYTQTNLDVVRWNCTNQSAFVSLDTDLCPRELHIQSTGTGALNIPAMTLGSIYQTGGKVNLVGNISIPSVYSYVNEAILDCGIYQISGDGNFTLYNDATIKTSHISGIDGNITLTGTKIFGVSNYVYNRTGDQETGSYLPVTTAIRCLEKDGGGLLTLTNDSVIVVDSLAFTNGNLLIPSNKHIDIYDTVVITGMSTKNGIALNDNSSYIRIYSTSLFDYINILIPIGTLNGCVYEYSPVDLYIRTWLGFGPHKVEIYCDNEAYDNNYGWLNYLTRYWLIKKFGNAQYYGTMEYLDTDIVGDEEQIVFGRHRGPGYTWGRSGGEIDRDKNLLIIEHGFYPLLYYSGIEYQEPLYLDVKVFLQGAYR